jgi:uncharacterized protein YaiI (UPF0178 family)
MRIWIDADACPRDVKDVVFRASARRGIVVFLVANKALFAPPAQPLVKAVQVPGGPDVADDHIVHNAVAGDLAITADIPLAARLVPLRVHVIDPRGVIYDEETIGERLSVRDFMTEVRDLGGTTGGPAAFSARDKQRFAAAFDGLMARAR